MSATYVLGVDLGQSQDPTALVVLEVITEALHVRHLERLALGTSYPDQVARIAALVGAEPLAGRCALAVDATGVGAPVVDLLRRAVPQVMLTAVTITGGDNLVKAGMNWHVPKRDLIAAAQMALQQGRLKVARSLAEAEVLVSELVAYRVSISTNGHASFENDWRQAPHDDLVLALAIAVYVAGRYRQGSIYRARDIRHLRPVGGGFRGTL